MQDEVVAMVVVVVVVAPVLVSFFVDPCFLFLILGSSAGSRMVISSIRLRGCWMICAKMARLPRVWLVLEKGGPPVDLGGLESLSLSLGGSGSESEVRAVFGERRRQVRCKTEWRVERAPARKMGEVAENGREARD